MNISLDLSSIALDFEMDDVSHKQSIDQAINLLRDAQNSSNRLTNMREEKISMLVKTIQDLTKAKESVDAENTKLITDISSLTETLQEYYTREERLSRREEDIKKREEALQTKITSLENEKYQMERAHEELNRFFVREREEHSRQLSDMETKFRDYEITIDIQAKKIIEHENKDIEFSRVRNELDEKIQSLLEQISTHDNQISNYITEKDELNSKLIMEHNLVIDLEDKINSIRREMTLEFNLKISNNQKKENEFNSKIAELEGNIVSLQASYNQLYEKFQATETSIHEMIRFLHAIKRGRTQLFTDFEHYSAAWRKFFDSNLESMKRQYQVVISSHTDQWVRKDSKLSSHVHSLLNELNEMTSARYPYPQLTTDIPRDIDIDVLLTKLYVPPAVNATSSGMNQTNSYILPHPPNVTTNINNNSGEKERDDGHAPYPFNYYTPQSSRKNGTRKGNRPASAGSSRGASERYKNNSNSSDYVKNMRSRITSTTGY